MVKAKNVPDSARAETGDTFAEQFGSGKIGMMGTGQLQHHARARPDEGPSRSTFGISLLPGMEAGQVPPRSSAATSSSSRRAASGSTTRSTFMKFLLSDDEQVEVYAKALNLTTRTDTADNKYFKAEPLVQDVAKALAVGRTPYTLTFFEQINSPQGPWLQMLQRAYYTDDDLDTVIADAQDRR